MEDEEFIPISNYRPTIMDNLKIRINVILARTNTKIDFLKGSRRCKHPHHAYFPKNLYRCVLEKQLHLKALIDKLVKSKRMIEYQHELMNA